MNREEKAQFMKQVHERDLVEVNYTDRKKVRELLGTVDSISNFGIRINCQMARFREIFEYSLIHVNSLG